MVWVLLSQQNIYTPPPPPNCFLKFHAFRVWKIAFKCVFFQTVHEKLFHLKGLGFLTAMALKLSENCLLNWLDHIPKKTKKKNHPPLDR